MSQTAIHVEGLGKKYRLGGPQQRYSTLGDQFRKWTSLRTLLRRAAKSENRPTFWALKDVSFDVKQGEVVGVIGRNGAGKSTLLKVLSRITEPTEGAVDIHGRVGSLLEVGTGFHPELTGRENIYLNGAILGMRRAETTRKFDEIVAFAEVEKFIDTQVKHYSSGMYTRLAFAVAAHMEPEILIIDEVLAVGDAQFQKKCLGKMGEVAQQGRTVLFVSHNMAVIQNLCTTGILLSGGKVQTQGPVSDVVRQYMHSLNTETGFDIDLREHGSRVKRVDPLICRVRLSGDGENGTDTFPSGGRLTIELHLEPKTPLISPSVGIGVSDQFGQRLFTLGTYYSADRLPTLAEPCIVRCGVDELPLAPGRYSLTLAAGSDTDPTRDWLQHVMFFTVVESDYFYNGNFPRPEHGSLLVRSRWTMEDSMLETQAEGHTSHAS